MHPHPAVRPSIDGEREIIPEERLPTLHGDFFARDRLSLFDNLPDTEDGLFGILISGIESCDHLLGVEVCNQVGGCLRQSEKAAECLIRKFDLSLVGYQQD